VNQIAQVEVGGFDDWKGLSDHRPLVVDIDFNSEKRTACGVSFVG
jgi:hypothetical protein